MILCGGAINSPQLLQLSGVGRRPTCARSASTWCTTCPVSARTSRTTSRSTSSTRPPAGLDGALLRDAQAARGGAPVAVAQVRPGRQQPLRGRRVRARQRRGRLPEPDVPLPPDRGPLRRHAAPGRRRPRLPGARGADVLGRAREREGGERRPARPPGAAVQLPLDRERPARVGRGDPRDPQDPLAARLGRSSTAASCRRAPRWRPTSRSSTGSRRTPRPRCTLVHLPHGHDDRRWWTRARCACTAWRACGWWTPRCSPT